MIPTEDLFEERILSLSEDLTLKLTEENFGTENKIKLVVDAVIAEFKEKFESQEDLKQNFLNIRTANFGDEVIIPLKNYAKELSEKIEELQKAKRFKALKLTRDRLELYSQTFGIKKNANEKKEAK